MVDAQELVRFLRKEGLTLALAESLTGGMVSEAVAGIEGASKVFWGGIVCYSPDAKMQILGVKRATIEKYGTVSGECAKEMAEGALSVSGADIAASLTGLAGPEGDAKFPNAEVGRVYISTAMAKNETRTESFLFSGGRNEIRTTASLYALSLILETSKLLRNTQAK
jgi:nicotinamide-nucleotide amidase